MVSSFEEHIKSLYARMENLQFLKDIFKICDQHNILPMNKQRILFVLHLPPPVHGAAMMGKYIHDSRVINEAFECKYINLTSAKTLQDIGKEE